MATLSRGDASGRLDRAEHPSNGASINFEDARQTPPTVLMDALQVVLPPSDTAPDVPAGATYPEGTRRPDQFDEHRSSILNQVIREQRQPNGFADTRAEASTRPKTPPVGLPRLETGLRCASMQMNVVLGPPGAREANELGSPLPGGAIDRKAAALGLRRSIGDDTRQAHRRRNRPIVWATGRSPLLLQQPAETIEPPTTTTDRAPAEKGVVTELWLRNRRLAKRRFGHEGTAAGEDDDETATENDDG
ncbi:hypothetical protein HPB47_022786 [Ixodes persulcatus]|uniref:Uncharacterized protein n=1 Tax=Ixodes persulcatus TaxID=34615 RepID=A0AC60QAP6_IXOPE|nr:hypothetical protein HPB47_022786 [Ixodes persulcatus]